LGGRQRLLAPRPGLGRPTARRLAQPAPAPPAAPRLLAQPDRDLLLDRAAQGPEPQRLHRPGRGGPSAAGLPAPLRADPGAVRPALHRSRPGRPAAATRRETAARRSRLTFTQEPSRRSTKPAARREWPWRGNFGETPTGEWPAR